MTIHGRLRRHAAVAAALAFIVCGWVQPIRAESIGTDILYQLAEWMTGVSFDDPGYNQPVYVTDGDTLTDMIGGLPQHYEGEWATCLSNYPYQAIWPGAESGALWSTWTQTHKQTQTMFLAGVFVREGAWLDSISTQCTVVMPDGSWKNRTPMEPQATGLDDRGKPTTRFNALLGGVISDTAYTNSDGVRKMGGSPYVATCPRNSYVYGINAVVAIEKDAVARVGVHCVNPLTGATYYSGTRPTDNSDGTSNGLTYRLYPTTNWGDGVFCPQGQLATGVAGYIDTGDVKAKTQDHIKSVGLICHPYSFIKPPAFAQLGTDLPGNDIAQPPMTADDPNACAAACAGDAECKAWTYVFHNVRNETQCFLKKPVPLAVEDGCCVSGVKPPLGADVGVDRPGGDYFSKVIYSADPNLCADDCAGFNDCQSWTYLKPGVRGKNAICYYKNTVPQVVSDPCCISGLKSPFTGKVVGADPNAQVSVLVPDSPFTTPSDALNKGGGVALLTGIPTTPSPAPGVTFGGAWQTVVQNGKLYTMKLSQNASGTVVGGYGAGTITDGVIVGNQLYARWHQGDAAGTLDFIMAPDNATFAGIWTNGDFLPTSGNAAGTWDGYNTAVFTGVPGGDDFTGSWTVTQSEGDTYDMTLAQGGDVVTGTYDPGDRAGTIRGHDMLDNGIYQHLVFDPAKNPGDGWVQAGGNGSGWFYLYPDKNHLSGVWRMADNTFGAWSAVRKDIAAATAPAPVQVPGGECPGPTAKVTQTAKVHVGLGDAIPGVTLAAGTTVACLACQGSWCLIASTALDPSAAGQSPTVSRKLLDFGTDVAEAPDTGGNSGNAPAPPPPPPKVVGNFAGDWVAMSGRSNCYDWHLDQQGASVSGRYNPLNATITGTVTGSQLQFEWTEHDANMRPTSTGSGLVRLTGANGFDGDWWSPPAPVEPFGNDPADVWHATRHAAGQGGCASGVANGGTAPNGPLGKLGKLGGKISQPSTIDEGGSANAPPPPVIR